MGYLWNGNGTNHETMADIISELLDNAPATAEHYNSKRDRRDSPRVKTESENESIARLYRQYATRQRQDHEYEKILESRCIVNFGIYAD